ncbi:YoaK family protein [Bosea sp. 117]|uniref:YoaK family protein n=1 Tax=Bosea sp. 117 TaxID=1125973 RepID=UPI0009DF9B03|nr:YoaK family protein [Bosea sp. 117]
MGAVDEAATGESRAGTKDPFRAFGLASAITFVAGFIDAVGYAHVGNLYLSFMSGNTTRLGMALAGHDYALVVLAGAVIASFVVGSGLGTLIVEGAAHRSLSCLLGAEAVLVAVAMALFAAFGSASALVPVAAAMGMQNNAHQVVLHADIGKSFVTGALFSLGQSFARALRDRASPREWLVYAASWLSFIAGVTTGATVLLNTNLLTALAIVFAALAALALAAWRRTR